MKFVDNWKIKTKVLWLVLILISFTAIVGHTGISAINFTAKATSDVAFRANKASLIDQLVAAELRANRSEYSIAVEENAQSVADASDDAASFKRRFVQAVPTLQKGSDAAERKMLDDVMTAYQAYENQLDTTLSLANGIYGANALYSETGAGALKQSILASESKAATLGRALQSFNTKLDTDLKSSETAAQRIKDNATRILVAGMVISVISGMGIGWLIASEGVTKPLKRIVTVLQRLSQGDLAVEIIDARRKDEVGDVAQTALIFKEALLKNRELAEAERQEQERKIARQKTIDGLIFTFDRTATETVTTVASASTQLSLTAEEMSRIASDTNHQSSEVASASRDASQNVQSVASAAEEMAATVQEISRQIVMSNELVRNALGKAEAADNSSRELVEMSRSVGAIATLIENITGQINLLALNATIESARSGEAGKGFAVVANEVKNLATQTARATEQIRQQLDGVQKTAVGVADMLGSVRESIGQVNESSAAIASAVEEQSAATKEIASNMYTATRGVEQINNGIVTIKGGTDSTTEATRQVVDAARMLSVQAEKMDTEVKSFLRSIQAA